MGAANRGNYTEDQPTCGRGCPGLDCIWCTDLLRTQLQLLEPSFFHLLKKKKVTPKKKNLTQVGQFNSLFSVLDEEVSNQYIHKIFECKNKVYQINLIYAEYIINLINWHWIFTSNVHETFIKASKVLYYKEIKLWIDRVNIVYFWLCNDIMSKCQPWKQCNKTPSILILYKHLESKLKDQIRSQAWNCRTFRK